MIPKTFKSHLNTPALEISMIMLWHVKHWKRFLLKGFVESSMLKEEDNYNAYISRRFDELIVLKQPTHLTHNPEMTDSSG